MGTPSPTDAMTSITMLETHHFKVVLALNMQGYKSTQGMMTLRPSTNTCALPPMYDNDIGETVLFQAHFKAEKGTANTLHVCGVIIQPVMVWFVRTRSKIILVMTFLS